MVHVRNGILPSHKKWNTILCNNFDGPQGYYANYNLSDKERQTPYDVAYVWNLKKHKLKKTDPNS